MARVGRLAVSLSLNLAWQPLPSVLSLLDANYPVYLENNRPLCYSHAMNKITPSPRAPQSWIDAIEQAESAGKTLDFEEVMQAFDAEDASELEAAGKAPDRRSQRSTAVR